MLHLEIQEGKDAIKFKDFVCDLRSQAACTKRLATASSTAEEKRAAIAAANLSGKHLSHDPNNGLIVDCYAGDSWFASVPAFFALIDCRYECGGVVKTSHSGFPRF